MIAGGIDIGEERVHCASNKAPLNGNTMALIFDGQVGQKVSWPRLQFSRTAPNFFMQNVVLPGVAVHNSMVWTANHQVKIHDNTLEGMYGGEDGQRISPIMQQLSPTKL